jgi:phage-related holin
MVFPVFGISTTAISIPVLFTKFGLRVPPVLIEELKKLVAELPE